MKKLRLIKPWRLRAVRQRVDNEVHATEIFNSTSMPAAPRSEETAGLILRNRFIANSIRFTHNGVPENGVRAPFSDVIFVCSNRQ